MATPRKTRLKIGVIGLGIIGSRVAANLRAAGHQVYVWSRSPHSAPNFLGSVVEVADLCDIIQIFVSDDAALLEVARTMAAALSPRHIVAVHATVSPAAARQTAAIVESQGARYLDAPFTGSKMAAQNAQLVYYIGGSEQALAEVRPALEARAQKILHGGGVGDASVRKIATNMLTATTVQTLSEMLALVRSAGVDGAKLAEALEHNASRSGTSDLKLPAILAQNFEPNFSLKHMLKDLRLATALAENGNVALPVTRAAKSILTESLEKGWGDEDFCAVAKNYDLPPRPEPEPVAAPTPSVPKESTSPIVSENLTLVPDQNRPPTPPVSSQAGPVSESATTASPLASPLNPPDPNRAKKNTLRIIRDFFKPVEAERK